MMGGELCLESEAGHGSTFAFSLPLPRCAQPSITPEAEAFAPGSDAGDARPPMRVLLVEDNPENVLVGRAFLKRMGMEALVARDGRQALSLLAQEQVDVVLMDLEMPHMDGLEASRRIRAGEAGEINRQVPIVALTAHALPEYRQLCGEAGMDSYLPKPVNFAELMRLLQRIQVSRG